MNPNDVRLNDVYQVIQKLTAANKSKTTEIKYLVLGGYAICRLFGMFLEDSTTDLSPIILKHLKTTDIDVKVFVNDVSQAKEGLTFFKILIEKLQSRPAGIKVKKLNPNLCDCIYYICASEIVDVSVHVKQYKCINAYIEFTSTSQQSSTGTKISKPLLFTSAYAAADHLQDRDKQNSLCGHKELVTFNVLHMLAIAYRGIVQSRLNNRVAKITRLLTRSLFLLSHDAAVNDTKNHTSHRNARVFEDNLTNLAGLLDDLDVIVSQFISAHQLYRRTCQRNELSELLLQVTRRELLTKLSRIMDSIYYRDPLGRFVWLLDYEDQGKKYDCASVQVVTGSKRTSLRNKKSEQHRGGGYVHYNAHQQSRPVSIRQSKMRHEPHLIVARSNTKDALHHHHRTYIPQTKANNRQAKTNVRYSHSYFNLSNSRRKISLTARAPSITSTIVRDLEVCGYLYPKNNCIDFSNPEMMVDHCIQVLLTQQESSFDLKN